ncbi:hypothetical protein E2R33_08140 [Rathayibacter toxicus]|nr:hypothetical protein E2R33_08140 [Rathayibacter toxicus]
MRFGASPAPLWSPGSTMPRAPCYGRCKFHSKAARDCGAHITAVGDHYLLTVKKDQPTLYRLCKNLLWTKFPRSTQIDIGHDRRMRRTIKTLQQEEEQKVVYITAPPQHCRHPPTHNSDEALDNSSIMRAAPRLGDTE